MPIRSSVFANESDIGRGFSNLAAMFAPPDSADLANYATARAKNQGTDIIAKLRQDPRYAGFDDQAILAGLYNPTQSFYKVNTDDATTRRGQDITSATSMSNNAADNQRAIVTAAFGPLAQGEVRPEIPLDIAQKFDLPAIIQANGAPKPLSETEVKGGALQQLSPDDLHRVIMGDVPVENTVGPNGSPVITSRADAVGKEPYFNKGAEAKPENAVALLPDGKTQVAATQGEDGRWYNAQTKELLPEGFRLFKMPQAVGTATDVGLPKSTAGDVDQQLIDIAITRDTATRLRELIAKSPSSQGIVGALRGTAQNLIETGGELGGFFGGKVKEVTDEIKNGFVKADLAGAFDKNIPAIEMLSNLLAFEYAKTTTGNRQLSNEMLKAAKSALGLDKLDANQADSLARIDQAIQSIDSQASILNRVRAEGINATGGSTPPAPDVTQMGNADQVPPDFTPEEWGALTPDEKQQVLDAQ